MLSPTESTATPFGRYRCTITMSHHALQAGPTVMPSHHTPSTIMISHHTHQAGPTVMPSHPLARKTLRLLNLSFHIPNGYRQYPVIVG
jgi:hypothetical protein